MSVDTRPCPLCGERGARSWRDIPGGIYIVRCQTCRLLFRLEVPADLLLSYTENYFRQYFDLSTGGVFRDYITERDRAVEAGDGHMKDLERLRRPGRLLDVGCATGFLLEAARRRGWDVVGLDISEFAVTYAQDQLHLDVRRGTVEDTSFPEGSFDVIIAFEYIEHVLDPVGTLSRLRNWLRPDGLLVMTTPNAGSWTAQRRPGQFAGFLEPAHVAYFTRCTMRQLLKRAGFLPIEIRTDLAIITRGTLKDWGAADPERWRTLVSRVAPGLKTWIRRAAGRWCGGPGMKVYARPKQSEVHQ